VRVRISLGLQCFSGAIGRHTSKELYWFESSLKYSWPYNPIGRDDRLKPCTGAGSNPARVTNIEGATHGV
jgi:hypothetical protein